MATEQQPNTDLEKDPDILAEKKKNRLSMLRWERYKGIASAVGFFLQTFRSEAISLTSGAGTLVMGYYQIKKYSSQSKKELRSELPEEHRLTESHHHKAMASSREVFGLSGGSSGTVAMEAVSMAPSSVAELLPTQDPGNYALVVFTGIFVWASIVAWVKKRRKKEASNGSV